MRITRYQTKVVRVPVESGPVDLLGPDPSLLFVLLNLETDTGLSGISYAGFTNRLLVPALKSLVDNLAEECIGRDPVDTESVTADLFALAGSGAPAGLVTRAIAAIDVAMWDLKGKQCALPVYKLLGGFQGRVATYYSGKLWRSYTLDELADTAAELVQQGHQAMKFRMGAEKTVAKEMERMTVMREAVGPDIDLMLDINQGWDINRSITVGRKLSDYNLYWLEDPIDHQDHAGLAQIADALDTPVAAGEYHYGLTPLRYMLEYRSADILMVDLLRVGGITPWMKAAHLAEAFNIPVVSHLAPEFLAHAVAASPNGLTVEWMPWTFPLFKEPPRIHQGMLELSPLPGFGLEFDNDAITRMELK